MRNSCIDCVRKHLGQACVLADEVPNYPHHKWIAIGHMAEAESEARDKFPGVAETIHKARTNWMYGEIEPDFDYLIRHATIQAGEELVYAEGNSKTFASAY